MPTAQNPYSWAACARLLILSLSSVSPHPHLSLVGIDSSLQALGYSHRQRGRSLRHDHSLYFASTSLQHER